ncbi:MAG: GTP 3',8-cyclase MoaA [Thermodesulfobacteriota bacterium]
MEESKILLKDTFGRVVNNLRISVTDRCNFRCKYCMPARGMVWLEKDKILSFEEIARLAEIFSGLGVDKIRLTGGEPLLRKELHVLVAMLAGVGNVRDISLTTNGYFLEEQARALSDAGLKRINVSLDSLRSDSFAEITRRSYYDKVLRGVAEAARIGLSPIKINVVLIRGFNDGEILDFAELARKSNYIIRFIEYMPIGGGDDWNIEQVITQDEIIKTIEHGLRLSLIPKRLGGSEPADGYLFEDGSGEIGFISSVSNPFCGHCNRVRITSDGKLRTCLFSLGETDLRNLLREGASDLEIRDVIVDAVSKKERGHLINKPGFVKPARTMSQIGG